jgi:aryl-alcohol dehydrogenase-like predicted oxidoreductase
MAPYPQRTIGNDKVSAQGLGCMGMSMAYTSLGGYDDVKSLATLTEAADLGITFVCIASAHLFAKQLLNLGLVGYQ